MKLSEHFTLEEFCVSETAARLGLNNIPTPVIIVKLAQVASFMEQVRTLLGDRPIQVNSGYRSPEVNSKVGGVLTSAHCRGLACDFTCAEFGTTADIALAVLKSGLEYDQLILEYGWVHIGLAEAGTLSRREALTKRSASSGYECGINP